MSLDHSGKAQKTPFQRQGRLLVAVHEYDMLLNALGVAREDARELSLSPFLRPSVCQYRRPALCQA